MVRYFFSDHCPHLYPIIDIHEGTLVCPDCAKVLTYNNLAAEKQIGEQGKKWMTKIELILHDFCCNGNIPMIMETATIEYFNLLQRDMKEYNIHESEINVMVFSLYHTVNRCGANMSPQEIEALTGVRCGKLWKIETIFESHISNRATDLVNKMCNSLHLIFKDQQRIFTIVDNFPESYPNMGSVKNRSIVATAIYLYCKKIKLDYSMSEIANNCNTSITTIKNVMKKMTPHYVSDITLLIK